MLSTSQRKPTKLSQDLLDDHQHLAIDRLYDFDQTMLVAGMGAGKTIIALTAIQELIADGVLNRVVVFAPLKVCQEQWRQERDLWDHTQWLHIVLCTGTPDQREKIVNDMRTRKGILLVNFENMVWYFDTFKKDIDFDGLLIDELSKLKGGGKGFKKMRNCLHTFKWHVGMTGTPVSEDFEGLFYQVYTLDKGERLGKNKTKFLEKYFSPDYNGYDWTLMPDGAERIVTALAGLVYTVPDYRHELPPLNKYIEPAVIEGRAADLYASFETSGVLEIEGHVPQVADNPAVLSGKLQQLASGAIYMEDEWKERVGVHHIHGEKTKACVRLVKELKGEPVIICYWYQHELERLEGQFPNAVNLNDKDAMAQWNSGNIEILLVQPLSCSHGIQLQYGGRNIIFYCLLWSNDLVSQMIARVWRRGQVNAVNVWEIVTVGTVDELIIDRVDGKKKFDTLFHKLIKTR